MITFIALVIAILFHETAHAWIAHVEGDPTAVIADRGSLLPFAHINVFGTVALPLLLHFAGVTPVAFARPVPLNPKNFRHGWRSAVRVHAAGIAANALLALVALPFVLFVGGPVNDTLFRVNLGMALFNLLPIPPLDGWNLARAIWRRTA